MKKTSMLILVLILTATMLTACRKPMQDTTGTQATTTQSTTAQSTTRATTVPATTGTEPHATDLIPDATDLLPDGTDGTGASGGSDMTRGRRMPRR